MLEREPQAAQPAGVDGARCHRAEPAGPPGQQGQGCAITGGVAGHDLPQGSPVRDSHPGQLTGGCAAAAIHHRARQRMVSGVLSLEDWRDWLAYGASSAASAVGGRVRSGGNLYRLSMFTWLAEKTAMPSTRRSVCPSGERAAPTFATSNGFAGCTVSLSPSSITH